MFLAYSPVNFKAWRYQMLTFFALFEMQAAAMWLRCTGFSDPT